jgi:predicted dehydrogenase
MLSAAGEEIRQLSSFTAQLQEKLPPVDTVHAILATQSGRSGTFCLSFGTEFKKGFEIEVVTTTGAVTVGDCRVTTLSKDSSGEKVGTESFPPSSSVKPEVVAFANSIQAGIVDPRLQPKQALKDVEILQGMLESGRVGAAMKVLGDETAIHGCISQESC